ncbi:MAG: N-acetyltransferase [Thermomicrobiales bacterium]|nr:N-acetyltransferase [Thermomicrobiales bacterium]MCO5219630.1 N-acetyltransferase [Thermomicrobiales bacterium]MCO5224705.1 N-acetyltransferase [Thermomicrobiales bacterium]MCO5228821.1 N-acetyltransferase [Thermomicrobiales bacterium]
MSDIEVTRSEADSRFEAHGGGQLLGFIDYTITDDVIDLPHTKVFPEFEGQGVGSALVRQTLDQIREIGDLKVKPTCPFIEIWIKRHKDYHDLLA